MVLRMKNFNILGVLRKIWLVEVGAHENGQFVDLRGAWQKRGGGVFEGGCYTNAHYGSANMLLESKESREISLNLSNNKMVILFFLAFKSAFEMPGSEAAIKMIYVFDSWTVNFVNTKC